jgi:hypothetical protein
LQHMCRIRSWLAWFGSPTLRAAILAAAERGCVVPLAPFAVDLQEICHGNKIRSTT